MAPLLRLQGVSKRYGGTRALDQVSCVIDGRAVGLLGPNGAGKTTLMKVLLGLEAPDTGEVEVLGLDARTQATRIRGQLGFAAEGPGRLPGLSGLESVALAGELCGLPRRVALLRAHDMLDLVGLDEARYRPVETFSTGMHQRVKVAMALVHDPQLVLLDEPTSGLDPQSRDSLLALIAALRQGGGPAVLLSTHLLHDVERTCDTVVIMRRGQVRYAGPLAPLQAHEPDRWRLRTARPCPALAAALSARDATPEAGDRPELWSVRLPAGAGPALIWDAAAAAGAAVIQLEPQAGSLEAAFLGAIAEEEGG